MPLRYKDYYAVLGVPRSADGAAIKRAFRERAKAFHPDRRPPHPTEGPDDGERFREINEAYAVLGDPARRADYDALGAGHREGEVLGEANGQGPAPDAGPGISREGFSEFFTFLSRKRAAKPQAASAASTNPSGELEAELTLTLEEAISGVGKSLTLSLTEPAAFGAPRQTERKLDIKVPAGIRDGQRLRIKGSKAGFGRGDDLFLRVRVEPHPRFAVDGDDLLTDLRVSPWEAALGATIRVPTVDGVTRLKLPGGSTSGQRLRLKGEGLPRPDGGRGDLLYRVMISLPERLTPDERRLMEELADLSDYDPRRNA